MQVVVVGFAALLRFPQALKRVSPGFHSLSNRFLFDFKFKSIL